MPYITEAKDFYVNTGMSSYEKWSIAISIVAILISILVPVFQSLYKKLKKLKLKIIPFDSRNICLYYNQSGSYFRFSFCIECKNQDSTILSMNADIKSKTSGEKKHLEWSTFDSIYINWLGNNAANKLNTVSPVRPYKIKADSVEPFIVEFVNEDAKELQELNRRRLTEISRYSYLSSETGNSITDFANSFKLSDSYKALAADFEKYLFWKPGDYEIEFHVKHDLDVVETFSFTFKLTPEDYNLIRDNIYWIIFGDIYAKAAMPLEYKVIDKRAEAKNTEV